MVLCGRMTSPRTPCVSCPWRRSTPRHGFPGGRICAASLERAINGSPFDPAMQCHSTPDGENARVCVGFAQVVGFDSAPLRMAALLGRYDSAKIAPVSEAMHTPASMVRFHGAASSPTGPR